MVQVIRLKKSNLSLMTICLAAAMMWLHPHSSVAAPMSAIRTIGVIPLQTKHLSSSKDLVSASKHCAASFPLAVRQSKRFLVLDDDFVANMWNTADSRKDLVDDYELDAFVSLDIQIKNDTVLWYVRLISPRMETYLIESESMSRSTFGELTASTTMEKLQDVVFRTFNRLPVDATITSIQNKFVTLSAGKVQGINNGDEFSVLRPVINSTHPATGAWLSFSSTVLGKVKIVEVKDNSSIAEITHMTHDNSMSIGDGIKVSDLNSRLHFKRREAEKSALATDLKPQPTSPVYAATPAKHGEGVSTESAPIAGADNQYDPDQASNIPAENGENSTGDLSKTLREIIDYGHASAGFRMWSAAGAAAAESSFFPLNFAQADIGRRFGDASAIDAGGYFSFGGTKNGSFSGFGGYGRISYQIGLSPDLVAYVGGGGGLNSLAVDGEPFGGYDVIYASGFGAIAGQIAIEDKKFNWRSELELRPFNVGQIGAKGAKKQVDSSLMTVFRLGVFQDLGTDRLEWGGGLESYNGSFSLGQSDLSLSDLSFNASARIRF